MALTIVVRNPDGDIGIQQVFSQDGRCCPDLDGWNEISEAHSTRATVSNSPWRIKRCPRTFEEAPNDRRARPNIFHRVRWFLKGQFDLLPKYSLSAVASRPRMISQPIWKTIAASHSPAALIPRLDISLANTTEMRSDVCNIRSAVQSLPHRAVFSFNVPCWRSYVFS